MEETVATSAKAPPKQIRDAVVIIPGIMGTELVDQDGRIVWGLTPKVLLSRLALGSRALDDLRVTEEEVSGRVRLRPSRLLELPTALPFLGGIEPYGRLVNRVRDAASDPRTVSTFPYDWRLPVQHNARLLANHSAAHLERCRRQYKDAKIMLIAHSMGGLLAWAACTQFGLSEVSELITLGTPYFGAVKAVRMMESGRGAPGFLPRQAAGDLARTCPGVYDLLPRYRCLIDGGLRLITHSDLEHLGGEQRLAEEAQARWDLLGLMYQPDVNFEIHAIVGADQPTLQSMAIHAGSDSDYLESLDGVDYGGDGTVYRGSAAPRGVTATPLPQHHGTLAKSPEAITFVLDKLRGADTPPPLGTGAVGAYIPDLAVAGQPVTVAVTGQDLAPHHLRIASTDLVTGQSTLWHAHGEHADTLVSARVELEPGLHRVEIKHGSWSAVSDLVIVLPPDVRDG